MLVRLVITLVIILFDYLKSYFFIYILDILGSFMSISFQFS